MTWPDPRHHHWQSRADEIHRDVNRVFLTAPMADRAYRDDPLFNAQMKWMRDMLTTMDRAMDIVHIDPRQRRKVIDLLIYGQLPDGRLWPDSIEANRRIDEQQIAVMKSMTTPVRPMVDADGSMQCQEIDIDTKDA